MAEIARLASNGDEWFAGAFDAEPIAAMEMSIPFAAALRALRDQAPQLTPAELYDGVIHVDGLPAVIGRWGAMEQRLQNLETVDRKRVVEGKCVSVSVDLGGS